jgi:hypothetical protein
MKITNKSLIKFHLKYTIFLIALMIFLIQIYILLFEEEDYKGISHKSNFLRYSTKEDYCKKKISTKYLEYLGKCFLAFFSGCLISEKKFLRFGAI